jgi:hypothetical protein
MVWILIAAGIFLLIGVAMYAPDWLRWARWNSKRKSLPPRQARKLRPPAAIGASVWYGGSHAAADSVGAMGCGPDGGGADGGGCD